MAPVLSNLAVDLYTLPYYGIKAKVSLTPVYPNSIFLS